MKKFILIISLILLSQATNAEPLSISPLKYKSLEIKEANITIEVPKNWIQQGKKRVWSPKKGALPLVGFKWVHIDSDDWKPTDMLPKNSDFLGPFMLSLGWGEGLLYIVQIKTKNRTGRFEIHTVIPRMEAFLAYNFYASALNLTQMKSIEYVYQQIRQSGTLHSFKEYVSENKEECEDEEIELNCEFVEDEFFDEKGCGCLIAPEGDYVYDN